MSVLGAGLAVLPYRRIPEETVMSRALAVWILTALSFGATASADDPLPPPVGPRPVVPGPVPGPSVPAGQPPGARPVLPIPAPAPTAGGAGAVPAPRPAPPPVPVPASVSDYRVAPSDEVTIEVVLPSNVETETGNLFKSPTRIVVANDGTVDLPKCPGVRLDGRTRVEIRSQVQAGLKAAGISSQAEVLVIVSKYGPRFIYVVGAVNKTVEVSPFARTTILQVFAHCGDAMKDADMRAVRISSRGGMRSLDVRGVLLSGGVTSEAYVDPGDVVMVDAKPEKPVPVIPSVYIGGFVREPGAYQLYEPGRPGQPITLLKAIFNARGFADFAYQDEVVLRRVVDGQMTQQVINLERVLKGKRGPTLTDDPVLQQGDIVYVRGSG